MRKGIRIFELNDNEEQFDEIKEYFPVTLLLKQSEHVFLFLNPHQKTIWIWLGRDTNDKQKFLASYKAPVIKQLYGFGFKIRTADEGEEPLNFQFMVGTSIENRTKEISIMDELNSIIQIVLSLSNSTICKKIVLKIDKIKSALHKKGIG